MVQRSMCRVCPEAHGPIPWHGAQAVWPSLRVSKCDPWVKEGGYAKECMDLCGGQGQAPQVKPGVKQTRLC